MVVLVFVMFMTVLMVVVMLAVMVMMLVRGMHVELHALDGGLVLARDMEVIAIQLELFQLAFEFVRIHAQINQRADEHVSRDAAEDVEVKDFHCVVAAVCDRRKFQL